jgi:ribosomal protein L7/L12
MNETINDVVTAWSENTLRTYEDAIRGRRRTESAARVAGSPLSDEEKALADAGRLVDAVKAYRNRTGCLLLDAKVAVDTWRERVC